MNGKCQIIFLSQEEFKAEFIELSLGESYEELSILIPLTVVYSLYFLVGLLGNLATCIVINNNEYMRYRTII